MAEELPWELRRDSLSSFSHDCYPPLQNLEQNLVLAKHYFKDPRLSAFRRNFFSIAQSIGEIHDNFDRVRAREEPPPEAELNQQLASYRQAVESKNREMASMLGKLEAFHMRNKKRMSAEANGHLRTALRMAKEYLSQFPAQDLGRKIRAEAKPQNIFDFLRGFSQKSFIDRNGRPVKVIFRGKNVGQVKFDKALLYRALYNLVTDALSHTPGRPIYVRLEARDGQVAINVTNKGRKLKAWEIKRIGWKRFTRAWRNRRRGYGKISTRLLTEAQGGTFTAGNSRIGPMLSIAMPRVKRARRI